MADVFVSWAELRTAPASVIRSASASQTVDSFGQTATAVRITAAQVEISFAQLQFPGGLPSLNIEATQQVGDFAQSASLSDIIGQINGGGTITSDLPHRSVGGDQTVGAFLQSANIGPDGTPGPALISATQTVGDFIQLAVGDARGDMQASQQVGTFEMVARIIDPARPVAPPPSAVTGGYGEGPRKYRSRKNGRTVTADTWADLADALRRMDDADEPEVVEPPKRAKRIETQPDPMAEMRAEMAKQRAALEAQMAQVQTMALQGQQAVAQQYEARIAGAEQAARGAIAIAQRAKQDADALAALLTN